MPKSDNNPTEKQPKCDSPPNKRRKPDSFDAPVEMTNITDVNDDCLEHIFKHLTLRDLLNLADRSKALTNAARLVFKKKYGKHAVNLFYMKLLPTQKFCITDEEIDIYDFSTCLKMLRCCGASITKLATFSTKVPERERNELDRYLSEYCAESVVELEYGRATLEHLTKPFTKVEVVRFSHAYFRCEPVDMQRCFPRIRDLTLDRCTMKSAAGQFPHLQQLDMYVPDKQRENFAKFLQLNPQLRILRISGYNFDQNFLQILSECPQLESLYLEDFKDTALTTIKSDTAPVKFKNVRKFETDMFYLKRLDKANISIAFDRLDELTIRATLCDHDDTNVMDVIRFISEQSFLSKFTFEGCLDCKYRKPLSHLAKALPSVTEIRLQQVYVTNERALDFINECHLLKYFEFHLYRRAKFNTPIDLLGTEWRSSTTINKYIAIVKLER